LDQFLSRFWWSLKMNRRQDQPIPAHGTTRAEQLAAVQKEGYDLFVKKNTDYGDAFAKHGSVGVVIRLGDKISRLTSISKNKIEIQSETMRDTLLDLHNYCAMAIMLLDEK
jgi:hypothetical protein